MGFILLHDKHGDAVMLNVSCIMYAYAETFGGHPTTVITLISDDKRADIFVQESVDDIYRAIRRLTEDK